MNTRATLIAAIVAATTWMAADANAQLEPTYRQCKELRALEVAWQNFDTQYVNASREDVYDDAKQVAAALDQVAMEVRALSPAAFDQLREAHAATEDAIAATPEEATPAYVQDSIAIAKADERFAYQNLMGNIVCP